MTKKVPTPSRGGNALWRSRTQQAKEPSWQGMNPTAISWPGKATLSVEHKLWPCGSHVDKGAAVKSKSIIALLC